MLAGTKKHDRQALSEELDSLGIRIGTGSAGGAVAAVAVAVVVAAEPWGS